MTTFVRRRQILALAGATICGVPGLAYWWKSKMVVFADGKNPGQAVLETMGDPQISSNTVDMELIEKVPRLRKRKTDPKFIQSAPPLDELTLKNVHVFFRHGARTPIRPAPTEQVHVW